MLQTEPTENADGASPEGQVARIAVVSIWLRQHESTAPEESHPVDHLIEPYAFLLCGDAKSAASRLEALLKSHPSSLDTAILLAGARQASESVISSSPLHFALGDDPEEKIILRPKVLYRLNRLCQPLLERSRLNKTIYAALDQPTAAKILGFFANIYLDFEAIDEAISCLAQSIEIWPKIPDSYLSLFALLMKTFQFVPALELILVAQRRFPSNLEVLRAIGLIYRSQAMPEESLYWCGKLYHLDPGNFPDAIAYRCFVPSVCNSPEEANYYRRRMMRGLRALERQSFKPLSSYSGSWQVPSFSLAYQDVNNRRLLERQAAVFRHAFRPFMHKVDSISPISPPMRKGRKIRIAFISEYFSAHTNALAFEGLIKHLNKERFHTIVIHNMFSVRDATRDRIDSYCHEAIVLPKAQDQAAELISKLNLDVLFYTDIGMSPSLYVLALTRLAPIQLTGWGIPHTSGMNTIDAFISSELAEPAAASRHYTEQLRLVSRMPCCYLRDNLPVHTLSRGYFFLSEDAFVFGCLQQLHKLHPDFDEILEELARRNPDALFVFVEHYRPLLTHRVLERWKVRAPIMLERTRLLAHMGRMEFVALCDCVDILLDPPYYGSGITFYESAHTGTPTLSLRGRYLRSRFVAGCYDMIGLVDAPVADSASEYIDLGCSLLNDGDRLKALKTNLARKANMNLYDDMVYVREVEQVVLSLAGRVKQSKLLGPNA